MIRKLLYCIFSISLFYSCSSTKNIPEGKYLLNSVSLKADSKAIDIVELEDFVRQNPNGSIPLLGKLRLKIYNMAGQDTSKWKNRFIQKIGEAPVLFDRSSTGKTMTQLEKELGNKGYLNAEVDTVMTIKGQLLSLEYQIHENEPYRVRTYQQTVSDPGISKMLKRGRGRQNQGIKEGMLFDKEVLESELVRLNNRIRNLGYYTFSKDYLYFKADTTLNSHQVDLFLSVYPPKDKDSIYHRYKFKDVTILSGYDPLAEDNKEFFASPDTVSYKGINIIHGKNKFLRRSALVKNNFIRPDQYFSDYMYTQTYNSYNGIGAIKQTSIDLTPVPPQPGDTVKYLNALITLAPGNSHWFQTGIEGTNSAGDLGVAPNISYQHQNLFNGAEIFSLKLKGAYEFMNSNSNTEGGDLWGKSYYSYGAETSLAFPQILFPWLGRRIKNISSPSTQFSLGANYQRRPQYQRQFFNATITYRWMSNRYKYNHTLDFLDINYISMPWASKEFKEEFLGDNPLLAATYQDQLIARTAYTFSYTNKVGTRLRPDVYTFRAGVDLGGWLPRLVTTINGTKKNEETGQYQFLNVPYTEYIKGDVSFAHTNTFSRNNSIAYHVGLGVIQPFGNSDILPFEKRYFGGGANSVRGWSTRTLGPGGYKPTNEKNEFVNHVGDIKLEASFEYRRKTTDMIELAAFVDAGNIWTIKDYETQPGGLFKFSEFYKQIAVAYGVGFRFDLSFLLIRLDFGMKAYDPSRDSGKEFIMFKPKMSRDFAWHFAIGYPF